MTSVSSQPATGSLRVPDGWLHYELRGSGPLVVLAGAPMNADAFAPLADLIAGEFTVLTTDPRGIGRSPLDDPEQDSTPPLRADDLARLIEHVDAGPAAAFGSSGGACSVLALAQAHPERVRVVIAHEPPLNELVADRDDLHAATEKMIETYQSGDMVGAWRMFMRSANIMIPDPVLEQMFGPDRPADQLADERRWFAHELRGTTRWKPDAGALRAVEDKVVIGIGEDSDGQLCDRASRALGEAVGIEPLLFPGGHTGFADDPASFAERLRGVLAGTD
ncbi:alpha/beta fold hydrolase [Actinomadura bangladeshensis]|uniref:Alpha/beta hydrolase n=1 Tax=Actinomadura bangladeshensis TaxID=453573 RepID=A0A6L9Q9S9_9ACTN|nr:alpha/beta hydrolase [Actinomadura bangladeshensis]NEA21044.1 alpha/beta hydrolase [Actinomadura bangladeshensis]